MSNYPDSTWVDGRLNFSAQPGSRSNDFTPDCRVLVLQRATVAPTVTHETTARVTEYRLQVHREFVTVGRTQPGRNRTTTAMLVRLFHGVLLTPGESISDTLHIEFARIADALCLSSQRSKANSVQETPSERESTKVHRFSGSRTAVLRRKTPIRYQGKRFNGRATVVAYSGHERRSLPKRHDLVNHSPAGFEWGYCGSGPAQLAVALLADALGSPLESRGEYHAPHWLTAASSESMAPPRVAMCPRRLSATASAGSSPAEISSKNAPALSV